MDQPYYMMPASSKSAIAAIENRTATEVACRLRVRRLRDNVRAWSWGFGATESRAYLAAADAAMAQLVPDSKDPGYEIVFEADGSRFFSRRDA